MKTYNRLLTYLKSYKILLSIALCSSILFVITNSIAIWVIGTLVSKILIPNNIELIETHSVTSINGKLNYWTQNISGYGTPVEQLKMICLFLFFIYIIKNIFFYLSNISFSYIQNKIIKDMRDKLFHHISYLPISFFDKTKSAEITSIMNRDVTAIRKALSQSIQKLIVEPINILAFLLLLIIISPMMTLVAFVTIPISGFLIILIGKSIRRKSKRTSKQIAGLMNVLHENIRGARIIRAFTTENKEINRFDKENLKYFNLVFRKAKLSHLLIPINDIIGVLIGVILLWYGGSSVLEGNGLKPEDFMRFIFILFALMQPVRKLAGVNVQLQTGLASAERVFSILDKPLIIKDHQNIVNKNTFNNNIIFNNVTFSYDDSSEPSLNNINLNISKGQTIALVGSSGAGKSTLVDLIPRFYDTKKGEILIDDINIKNIQLKDLRKLSSIVTQDTILFNDSISNNISYGDNEHNINDIKKAAKIANIDNFIDKLPLGYNTLIGENGVKLSGGQKQRLSIARAILKNPPIIILDEATSSLDSETEEKLQKALNILMKNRTVIIIAHRLSTIMNSDTIAVLDKGKIIEIGTPQELLDNKGAYKKFYDLQFKNTSK